MLEVRYGLGRHIEFVLPTLSQFLHSILVGEIANALGMGFVKMSFCFFLLRLIDRTHRRIAMTVYSIMILNAAVTVAAVFCLGFQCRPLEKIWHPEIPGTCLSPTRVVTIAGGELPWSGPASPC